jgi:ornithine cyclodeaminase
VFPGNHGAEYDAHQGVVVLFDPDTGVPSAVLDASEITAIRTAAASGVATRALRTRGRAATLALLGSGVQARTHLEAMLVARRIERVRVYSPHAGRRAAFAARESERHGLRVEAVDSARAAVEGADLVCTTTSSKVPVLEGRWLAPGCHVNAAGACSEERARARHRGRAPRAAVRRPARVGPRRGRRPAHPDGGGRAGRGPRAGRARRGPDRGRAGRGARDEITLFESLGLAVEDLAAAEYLERVGRERGAGTLVELGGRRE